KRYAQTSRGADAVGPHRSTAGHRHSRGVLRIAGFRVDHRTNHQHCRRLSLSGGEVMTSAIHPQARIGHVHLTVSNLERALRFSRDVLGFEVTQRYGTSAAFLSAGGYHHHLGLNTWAGEGAPQPPAGRTRLYPVAI